MRQCDNVTIFLDTVHASTRTRAHVCVCTYVWCVSERVSEWASKWVSARVCEYVWICESWARDMSVYPPVWTRMSLLCSFRVSLSLSFARATVLLVVRDDRLSRISCTFFACPIVTFSFAQNKLLANRPWPISALCVWGSGHDGICFAIRSGSEPVRIYLKGIRTTKQP